MKKLFVLCLATVSIGLTACGKDNNPFDDAKEASEDRDIQGKDFLSSCSLSPISGLRTGIGTGDTDATIKSSRVQFNFKGNDITRTTLMYSGTDCSGNELIKMEETGRFDIQSNQKSEDGGKFIDIDYDKLEVTAGGQPGVDAANALKLCGREDWKADEAADVTEHAKEMNCYNAEVPRHEANIYRFDDGKIYFGADNKEGTTSDDQRPKSLSHDAYSSN